MDSQSTIKKTVPYGEFKSPPWQALKGKLAHTPTATARASHLRKIVQAINLGEEAIKKDFEQTMLAKYAKHNEDGSLFRPEDSDDGYDIAPENQEAFQKALRDFGKREVTLELNWRPLTPDTLADIKPTAQELELLGEFFSDESGPGIPPLQLQK